MSDQLLDCLGLKCPLPVMKARKRLAEMAGGDVLTVLTDDPVAPLDFEAAAADDGYVVKEMRRMGVGMEILLQKARP